MKIFRWLLSGIGYLVFILIILGIMLWIQFPAEKVKTRLEAELHNITPDLEWKIGSIGLSLPEAVKLTDVRIFSGANEKTPQLVLDSLLLQPDLLAYIKKKNLAARYTVKLLQGVIRGHLALENRQRTVQYDGTVTAIRVEGLKKMQMGLSRSISGSLSGNFSGKAELQDISRLECGGALILANGTLGLQKPVLGMKQVDFKKVSSTFNFDSKVLSLVDGKIAASLFSGTFSGTIDPAQGAPGLSPLHLKGRMLPRPELLSAMGDAAVITLVKKQFQAGKLPFEINGTLSEPGIIFSGLPPELNKQLQEGR